MARNIFQAFGDMWSGSNSDDTGNAGRRPDETDEQWRDRLREAARNPYSDDINEKVKNWNEAKASGMIPEGYRFDDYLIDTGAARNIEANDDGSATVNGRYMNAEEYENWYYNVRK